MEVDIDAVQAAYPDLVKVFSIGKSYQGRDIWAAEVSGNVSDPVAKPEVLIDGLHHSLEHLALEQTLYALHMLTHDYSTDPAVKNLVDTRRIWIIFAVNPDGLVYDLSGSPYHEWRKNRQPNAGTSAVGTDINRNYSYHWGCCGGSSGSPSAWNYRGPSAFSTPEAQAVRDFVLSRVVNGVQQIRTHVTFHTDGELILWPYGYTKTDIPSDMTVDDHATFVAMGKAMARTNGYKPEQSSDLYVTDGDEIDWLYGVEHIFSFTFELYPCGGLRRGSRLLTGERHRAADGPQPRGDPLPHQRGGLPVRGDRQGRAVLPIGSKRNGPPGGQEFRLRDPPASRRRSSRRRMESDRVAVRSQAQDGRRPARAGRAEGHLPRAEGHVSGPRRATYQSRGTSLQVRRAYSS